MLVVNLIYRESIEEKKNGNKEVSTCTSAYGESKETKSPGTFTKHHDRLGKNPTE